MAPPALPVKPAVRMIVPCLSVKPYDELETWSLIGLMSEITVRHFPATFPEMYVFIVLTDAEGDYNLSVELVSHDDEQVLSRVEYPPVSIPHRRAITQQVARFGAVYFMEPGAYGFRLSANGQYLGEAAIVIRGG